MKDAAPFTVDLEASKVQYLEDMAAKYHLPDAGKAIRCLIDYARDNPGLHDAIFNEIRCIDCGS